MNTSKERCVKKILVIVYISVVLGLNSCSYLKYSAIQAGYTKLQNADPSQVNLKHMLDQDRFYLWGKPLDASGRYLNLPMAIAAYSSKFKSNERVDTMFFKSGGTHYGLSLPEGIYSILIYADLNDDQIFDQTEVVGRQEFELNIKRFPEKIAKHININLSREQKVAWADAITGPNTTESQESLFYPSGTIRSLDNPIFDKRIATMGMYDPASFMEYAPTMFYAQEEDVAHKIPVIFVHGIGGSPRSFTPILEQLDKNRYRPWFFYYPSGGDLEQLASFFYSIFLSGEVTTIADMPVIVVAHSMGGLVVREALNKYQINSHENKVRLLVTIATPFGGHPAAAAGEKHGLITLPSWRDLNPQNGFIKNLYRKPLPSFVDHQLYYAFRNTNSVKLGENSDGTVPLSSQLHPVAQKQSHQQFGFNSGHAQILSDESMVAKLIERMDQVENIFPESHMQLLVAGGIEMSLGEGYSPMDRHLISYAGKYLILLAKGRIAPLNQEQEHYVQAIQGTTPAVNSTEKLIIRFMSEYPEMVKRVVRNQTAKNSN